MSATAWTTVCPFERLVPERGVAALVEGTQVAVYRLADDRVLAVQQRDPYSGANVLSRGIVGSVGETPTTGECLDPSGKEPEALRTFEVAVEDGTVLVRA